MSAAFAPPAKGVPDASQKQRAGVLRYYRFHARIYDATRWTYLRGRGAAVRALDLHAGQSVLEIGCGTGLNFARVLRGIGPGGRLVGVDFSQDMLARAQRRCRRRGWRNVELVQADAETLQLGMTFDRILCAYSLSMIADLPACLARAVQHLRPGGRLVILDFAGFPDWPGWARRAFAAWKRANHVHVERDPGGILCGLGLEVNRRMLLGGYAIVVTGTKQPPRV